jgi:ABC-type Na+ efflux pump permease subunit
MMLKGKSLVAAIVLLVLVAIAASTTLFVGVRRSYEEKWDRAYNDDPAMLGRKKRPTVRSVVNQTIDGTEKTWNRLRNVFRRRRRR